MEASLEGLQWWALLRSVRERLLHPLSLVAERLSGGVIQFNVVRSDPIMTSPGSLSL